MARIIYGGLVTEIKGSMGGTTFQSNRYGFTVKNKPNTSQANSQSQIVRKAALQSVSGKWLLLTPAIRAQWNAWATTYPTRSAKNPTSYLSGYNLFLRYALNLDIYSPSEVIGSPTDAPDPLGNIDIQVVNSAGDLRLIVSPGSSTATFRLLTYLSRPVRATQSYIKSWTRKVRGDSFTSIALDVSLTSGYESALGTIPATGQLIAAEFSFIQITSGHVTYIPKQILTVG